MQADPHRRGPEPGPEPRPPRHSCRRPRRGHAHTEATRLLCAGAHVNAAFRRRVVEELVGHAERPVAPPLGADVLPVLAHALRARRDELRTALLLLAVWAAFLATDAVMLWDAVADRSGGDSGLSAGDIAWLPFGTEAAGAAEAEPGGAALGGMVPGGWALAYAVVVLLLWCARVVAGRDTGVGEPLRPVPLPAPLVWLRRRFGWLLTYTAWSCAVAYGGAALFGVADSPYPVIFPLLIAAVVWRHQFLRDRTLRGRLARQTFAETPQPRLPAWYRRIERCVRREQDASLTLYDVNRPFVGAGTPRKPWSVVLELQRAEAESADPAAGPNGAVPRQGAPDALTARDIITMIGPRLRALRRSAAATSRDRLRQLEIEEFVYLPAGPGRDEELYTGDGTRTAVVYDEEQAARHLAEAAGEGGEARRHFLRIRVGAWNEQVVVSLLVRVHTQGGMLVLEVVPHVLGPIAPEFRRVDALVASEPGGPLRDALRACVAAPALSVALGITALRWLPSLGTALRLWLTMPATDEMSEGHEAYETYKASETREARGTQGTQPPQGTHRAHAAPATHTAHAAKATPATHATHAKSVRSPLRRTRLIRLLRATASRFLAADTGRAPDAPAVSLRQLAATDSLSLFQEMDVARYTRTLQDRIGEGVRDALRLGGYRTDRLEQHITQINNSGVYIKEMSGGALATGTHGQAAHTEKTPA
ncbi:hypothetical protein [Streptomyces flavofungini]|uniref:Integral membrane protein n=1 Tax=Streptomyces flavofungini TaxID=68200 RepID=A0ABS0X5I1_9ACTN|nr:hypothetical protein [Streptomyces flavofungini]MBJ3808453.1 hypothetical protein [Streptomyces flavofungini]GHC69657.1 hypothetical protein GCM10010349_44640 [Streptomyces flavofungini]